MTARTTPKIACPYCAALQSRVTNSRPNTRKDGVWRRRKCLACAKRFTTEETIRGSYDKSAY